MTVPEAHLYGLIKAIYIYLFIPSDNTPIVSMLPGPSETPESTFTRKIVKYYQYMEHVGYLGHKKKKKNYYYYYPWSVFKSCLIYIYRPIPRSNFS